MNIDSVFTLTYFSITFIILAAILVIALMIIIIRGKQPSSILCGACVGFPLAMCLTFVIYLSPKMISDLIADSDKEYAQIAQINASIAARKDAEEIRDLVFEGFKNERDRRKFVEADNTKLMEILNRWTTPKQEVNKDP